MTFVVPDQGVSKTISVHVDAGETRLAAEKLDVTAKLPTSPESSAAPAPECDPPYTTDESGFKHYKPDCPRH